MLNNNEIKYISKYSEINKIGGGNFGQVYLVQNKITGEYCAAKKISIGLLNEDSKSSTLQEISLLKHLKHPHIVEYKDSFIEDGYLIIVMEFCEEGDLDRFIKQRIKEKSFIPEEVLLNWILQLSFALNFIHTNKVLHRDIKTKNIFLTSSGIIKVGDFGVSKVLSGTLENANTTIGTPYYLSPEVIKQKPYSFKSDVWALGCIFYELCTYKMPFKSDNLLGLADKIINQNPDPIGNNYSYDLKEIIRKMLIKDVMKRPTIAQILNTDFMQNIANKFLMNNGDFIKSEELDLKNLTPMERLKLKKKHEKIKREEEIKKAIRENYNNSLYNHKELKQNGLKSQFDNPSIHKSNLSTNKSNLISNSNVNNNDNNDHYEGNPDFIIKKENHSIYSNDSDYVLNKNTKMYDNTINSLNVSDTYGTLNTQYKDTIKQSTYKDIDNNKELTNFNISKKTDNFNKSTVRYDETLNTLNYSKTNLNIKENKFNTIHNNESIKEDTNANININEEFPSDFEEFEEFYKKV